MKSILNIKNLSVKYQQDYSSHYAIQNLNLDLKEGETLGIVGESGCGKSTLALSILDLLPKYTQQEGIIHLLGNEITSNAKSLLPKMRGKDISIIFQDAISSLNPYLRIKTQLIETIQQHRSLSHQEILTNIKHTLDQVGLNDHQRILNSYPHQLSGGMNQRIMIAMAILLKPKLLIADEPTTALDVVTQSKILDLLKKIQKETGMALLLISHDLGVIDQMCEKIAVMYAGKIIEQGPCHLILKQPKHPYTESLIRCLPSIKSSKVDFLPDLPGQPPRLSKIETKCSFLDRCSYAKDICKNKELSPPLSELSFSLCHLSQSEKEKGGS